MKKLLDGRIKRGPFQADPKRNAVYFWWLQACSEHNAGYGGTKEGWRDALQRTDQHTVNDWYQSFLKQKAEGKTRGT